MPTLLLTDASTDPFPRATIVNVDARVYVVATRALAETTVGARFLTAVLKKLRAE
jgi:hypothetical protein